MVRPKVRPKAAVKGSKKPVIIDITPDEDDIPALPKPKAKKVTVDRAGEKGYDVEIPVEDEEIQDGDMLNQMKADMTKIPQQTGFATVGLSLGATINMGDYQSARVDCFIIRNVPDNDKTISKAYTDISRKLSDELSRQIEMLSDNE